MRILFYWLIQHRIKRIQRENSILQKVGILSMVIYPVSLGSLIFTPIFLSGIAYKEVVLKTIAGFYLPYLIAGVVLRLILQPLPGISLKPYRILNIKKKELTVFVTALGFLNINNFIAFINLLVFTFLVFKYSSVWFGLSFFILNFCIMASMNLCIFLYKLFRFSFFYQLIMFSIIIASVYFIFSDFKSIVAFSIRLFKAIHNSMFFTISSMIFVIAFLQLIFKIVSYKMYED